MRYWLLRDGKVEGPFEAAQLARLKGFGEFSKVREETYSSDAVWQNARNFPELAEALGIEPGAVELLPAGALLRFGEESDWEPAPSIWGTDAAPKRREIRPVDFEPAEEGDCPEVEEVPASAQTASKFGLGRLLFMATLFAISLGGVWISGMMPSMALGRAPKPLIRLASASLAGLDSLWRDCKRSSVEVLESEAFLDLRDSLNAKADAVLNRRDPGSGRRTR